MPRKKLKRFAELDTFSNVIQGRPETAAKRIRETLGNDKPITLELACGKGEYTLSLAQRYTDKNFIGIDRKRERIWKGAKSAIDLNLSNVIFLRMDIEEMGKIFDEDSISEIWMAFPDPHSRERNSNKRLTSPHMLSVYGRILKPDGLVYFKTDDSKLFKYTLRSLKSANCIIYDLTEDLYGQPISGGTISLKTTFEARHIEAGRTIKFLCFGFIEVTDTSNSL